MTPTCSTRKWSVSKKWRRVVGLTGIGIVGLAVMLPITRTTQAQEAPEAPVVGAVLQTIAPTTMLTVEPAERRSIANLPPAALEAPIEAPAWLQQPRRLSDLPADVYNTIKEQAALGPQSGKGVGPLEPGALAPPLLRTINFEGVNQTLACACAPPDPHGAIGRTHYVQVTNSHLDIYTNAAVPVKVKSVTLNSFFGESLTNFLFDPRAVYDPIWNRWIIVATRRGTSATDSVKKFRLAVSQTSNPTGSYYLYTVNFPGNNGDFWDYPQLGFDQDAVFVTGNIFSSASIFRTTAMLPFAKAILYNGLGGSVPFFTAGLVPTLAPPIVRDQNANAYFVAANISGRLHLYRGTNLSNPPNATLVLQAQVAVPAYAAPPDAPQPGTVVRLDTLDRRFVNASSQVGDSLWNTHTIALGSFSAPRFYQIDTEGSGANTVKQQGFYFKSGTSFDFNASIAANAAGEAIVGYSATDPPLGTQAQVRFSGRQPADPLNVIPAGSALFTSSTFYQMFGQTSGTARWGDYSAVSLDPNASGTCAANRRAWITNQKNNGTTTWGTRIGRIGFC